VKTGTIRRLYLALVLCVLGNAQLKGITLNSFYEPVSFHTIYGSQRGNVPQEKSALSIHILPYYQHAKNAKNRAHEKVPLGDRLGRTNMLGLLIGDTPSSYASSEKFSSVESTPSNTTKSVLHKAYYEIWNTDNTASLEYLGSTYTYDGSTYGHYSTQLDYEKLGVRATIDYAFGSGLGLMVNCGVAQYRGTPSFISNPTGTGTSVTAAVLTSGTVEEAINDYLLIKAKRELIETELGIDFSGVDTTGAEDASVELYWRRCFKMKDAEGDHVLTAIPSLAASVTFPTAKKKKVGKIFDIALGNDGFYAFTGQGEIMLDFPGMVQFGIGGSVTLFNEDDIGLQHVPTSEYQFIAYPWKISVTKRPGTLWRIYTTMQAHHFIDYISCYFNYEYVVHEKDSLTLSGTNKSSFLAAKLAKDGEYSAQVFHVGLDFEVTPALKLGVAVQSVFSGKQVWKSSTIAGSLAFVF